jgi:hypothetical protein
MLGRQRDHTGFEQETSKPEQVAPSASARGFTQPRGRVDLIGEPVEILDR